MKGVSVKVITLPKHVYVVPRYYTRRLLRNLWRALKTERRNFIHGRVSFANHVATVITNASHNSLFKYDDGKPYEVLDAGVDGKTIDNFINKSSSIFFLERDEDIPSLKTAIKTLQYLHIFLWCAHPERVMKWKPKTADTYDDLIVKNLDDDFSLFESITFFPFAVKLYNPVGGGKNAASYDLSKLYNSESNFDLDLSKEYRWPILGILKFFPVKGDIINRCVFLSTAQWERIITDVKSNGSKPPAAKSKFDYKGLIKYGTSISFHSKNIDSYYHEPEILKDQTFTGLKIRTKLKNNAEYIELQFIGTQPNKVFPFGDHLRLHQIIRRSTAKIEQQIYNFLPVPLSPEDDEKLNRFCNFIT